MNSIKAWLKAWWDKIRGKVKPPTVPTDVPIVIPDGGQTANGDTEIKADPSVKYADPDKMKTDPNTNKSWGVDRGPEIWNHNWHRMNIRVHANPGEFRGVIPASSKWYPIDMSKMPADTVTLTKTPTGCIIAAKRNPVSSSGQHYRLEAIMADGLGGKMQRVSRIEMSDAQMRGAVLIWYATVKP